MLKLGIVSFVAMAAAFAMVPSVSSAQATRTWVSGVGDDANPCSRTAPCKTFAGAISKTATGGEINAIDSGGFGAVTITKSITIDGHGHMSSILSASTNGIIVNTTNLTDKVTIRDLRINGVRKSLSPGVNGIRFIRGGLLVVDHVKIFGFATSGITMENNQGASPFARMVVTRSSIHDNAKGILIKPGASGISRATIRHSDLDDNGDGIVVDSTLGGTPTANIVKSAISDSGRDGVGTGFAVHANGANSIARIAGNEIVANVVGLRTNGGGAIQSAGDNDVFGNLTDGSPTSTFGKR